jgi:splicing factor 3B subunit 4
LIQNDDGLVGYGFIEFLDVNDADYAIQIMSMVKLYTRPLRVNKSSLDKKSGSVSLDVGANLFIGNLDGADVDEKLLYDTFSAFGTIIRPPKIMRDDMTNQMHLKRVIWQLSACITNISAIVR